MLHITATRRLAQDEPIPFDLLLLADEELEAIERYIRQSEIYVVEISCVSIAVYVLYPVNRQTAEIKAIAVDESYQNQGIGKFMLKDAEIKAREKGFSRLLIGTPATAVKQLAIYQKAGFVPFDVLADFYTLNYSRPIVEDGVQLKDMALLEKMIA